MVSHSTAAVWDSTGGRWHKEHEDTINAKKQATIHRPVGFVEEWDVFLHMCCLVIYFTVTGNSDAMCSFANSY